MIKSSQAEQTLTSSTRVLEVKGLQVVLLCYDNVKKELVFVTSFLSIVPPLFAVCHIEYNLDLDDQVEQIQEISRRIDAQQAYTSLNQTNLAIWQLARNANTRLVLENLFLTYPIL